MHALCTRAYSICTRIYHACMCTRAYLRACMCTHICMHACAHAHISCMHCAHAHIGYAHAYMHAQHIMHACLTLRAHTYMHVHCAHAHMHECTCTSCQCIFTTRGCSADDASTSMHAGMCARKYTSMHVHTHTCIKMFYPTQVSTNLHAFIPLALCEILYHHSSLWPMNESALNISLKCLSRVHNFT